MKTILVVDDNLTNLRLVQRMLADSYNVILAKSGRQALAIAARLRPNLVLLDVEMPEMDGFATIETMRRDPALSLANVPIIFLSAHSEPSLEARARGTGADDFLSKPLAKPLLLSRIALHLSLAEHGVVAAF